MLKNEEEVSIKSEEEKENDIDIIDIIEKNKRNIIRLKSINNCIKIDSKSIEKIFSIIADKNNQNISDIYIDHITINILAQNKLPDININNDENIGNNSFELDKIFIDILNRADIFYINFGKNNIEKEKNENLLNTENNKNIINEKSLKKIFKYLSKSIIDMSDYINLVILYLNENNNAKFSLEQKILEKYKNENIHFIGKKEYNSDIKVPKKNKCQNIYEFDILFNNVLDYIDDYDKESSFSDNINNLIIPRKSIDEDLIKVVNVSFIEEGILTNDDELENDGLNNENKKKRKKIKHSREPSNSSLKDEGHCNKNLCKGLCFIF